MLNPVLPDARVGEPSGHSTKCTQRPSVVARQSSKGSVHQPRQLRWRNPVTAARVDDLAVHRFELRGSLPGVGPSQLDRADEQAVLGPPRIATTITPPTDNPDGDTR